MQQSQNSFDKMKNNSVYRVKRLISRVKFKKNKTQKHYSLKVEVSYSDLSLVLWV